ncbi:MAG: glycosyltransferase family 2 protein [Candidatus Aquicultorales bacterium]
MDRLKTAVVVPAFNEAGRIGTVLETVLQVPGIDEVFVVDDGSTDGTAEEAARHDVTLIRRPANGGKGAAIASAREAVDADIIVFIDADLVGLKPQHVQALVQPLIAEPELMMTVGKFVGGRLRTDLAQRIVPTISGQRAVRKELFTSMPDPSNARFGVEVIFTNHAKVNRYPTREILIDGVTQVMKEEKLGYLKGLWERAAMYRDLLKEKLS